MTNFIINQSSKNTNKAELLEQLDKYPPEWRFTQVNGNKQPCNDKGYLQKDWQINPLTASEMKERLKSSGVKAIGLLTGQISSGIMAFDHDGSSCDQKIQELSGKSVEDALPKTVGYTSQREGRYQLLYRIPQEYWDEVWYKEILTGVKTYNPIKKKDEEEQIEFRWSGQQSVIAGEHPETGAYSWLPERSPWDCEVATAPQWMIKIMLRTNNPGNSLTTNEDKQADIEKAKECLVKLKSERANNYYDWLKVGMALHSASDKLLPNWIEWSRQSDKFVDGECEEKWKGFRSDKNNKVGLGTLINWAKEDTSDDSDWVKEEKQNFNQLCDAIDNIFDKASDQGLQNRLLRQTAKKYGYQSNINQMMGDYHSAERNALKSDFIDIKEYVKEAPCIDYLIGGILPSIGVAILYGASNLGKTTLYYSWAAAIASGKFWNQVPIKDGVCLIYQLEESQAVTADRFSAVVEEIPKEKLLIKKVWSLSSLNYLKRDIEKYQPVFVVIDSLKAASAGTGLDENDSRFADSLYQLHQYAEAYGVAILVIHHSNRGGDLRGSTAIKGAVDTVLKFSRDESLPKNQRILTIEKSRALNDNPSLLLEGDDENILNWKYLGVSNESEQNGNRSKQDCIKNFLDKNAGKQYTVEEVANSLGRNRETVKKSLNRLAKNGSIGKNEDNSKKPTYHSLICPDQSDKISKNIVESRVSDRGTETGQTYQNISQTADKSKVQPIGAESYSSGVKLEQTPVRSVEIDNASGQLVCSDTCPASESLPVQGSSKIGTSGHDTPTFKSILADSRAYDNNQILPFPGYIEGILRRYLETNSNNDVIFLNKICYQYGFNKHAQQAVKLLKNEYCEKYKQIIQWEENFN